MILHTLLRDTLAGEIFTVWPNREIFFILRGLIFADEHIIDFRRGFNFADFANFVDKYPSFWAKLAKSFSWLGLKIFFAGLIFAVF